MFSPRRLLAAAALASASAVAGPAAAWAGSPTVPSGIEAPAATAGVQELAAALDFNFGAAVDAETLDDPAYQDLLTANVTTVSTTSELSFATVQPEPGVFDFTSAEQILDFAEDNGLTVRAHDLIRTDELPAWITDGAWDATSLSQVITDHVTTVVRHVEQRNPGIVTDWDVVGRALLPDGTLRPSVFQTVLGDGYLKVAFDAARAAAPDARLFYGEFFDDVVVTQEAALAGQPIVPGANAAQSTCAAVAKCAGAVALVSSLLERGTPIDGVGIEAHLFSPEPVDLAAFSAWVSDLGLQWAITEFDVPLPATEVATPEVLSFQADTYRAALSACVESPSCDTFVTWGISDRLSTMAEETAGVYGGSLWLDANDQPKPAYEAIRGVFTELVGTLEPPATSTPTTDAPAIADAAPSSVADDTADGTVDDDSANPVVPILVGLGALAAIGVVVLVVRRRR
jgi:endo-1,4-beta-xylanase